MTKTRTSTRAALAGAAALAVLGAALIHSRGPGLTASARADEAVPGAVHHIVPADLPPPFATPSANNGPNVVARPAGAQLSVPAGFHISAWAEGLNRPRVMRMAPNGDVFVTESAAGRLSVLRANGAGPPTRTTFTTDLKQPFGIAFYPLGASPKYVYVANTDSVVRFPYHASDREATGPAELVTDNLPGGGYHQHWTRDIAFSPDGKKLFVSVGSQSNVGEEEERRAAILQFNPDGTGYKVYASGLRNAVGITFHPVTGQLWAAVNERDGLGDDLVPDYVTSVKEGGFYGWPYYYIGAHHDPRMPEKPALAARAIVPDVLLASHSAALSVKFYEGAMFPASYRGSAFVGLHGSWNRAARTGYKVVRVPMDRAGHARGSYEDFVTGWALPDGTVWGRPVDVTVVRDGALLISDDASGTIWRVTYGNNSNYR